MATYSKNQSVTGFCVVDNGTVAIPIEYVSSPWGDEGGERTFIKNSNQCRYLFDGRCSLGRDCEIYKNAKEEFTERIGKK